MKYLFLLIFLLCHVAVTAQRCFKAFDAPTGGNEIRVFCVGQPVYFRDCAGLDADKEYYDYDSRNGLLFDTPEGRSKTHTFTQPGTYTVTQFGNLNGVNDMTAQTFEVKTTAAPSFTAAVCSGYQVTVNITDTQYDTYSIDFGDGKPALTAKQGQQLQYVYAEGSLSYDITVTGSHNEATCSTISSSRSVIVSRELFAPRLISMRVLNKSENDGILNFNIIPSLDTNIFSYFLEEITNNGVISSKPLVMSNQPGLVIEKNINTTRPSCYRIRATDACGNEAVSTTVCSVILTAAATESGSIILNWNTLAGVPGSQQMNFELLLLDQQGKIYQTIPVTGNTFSHIPDDVAEPILRYQVKASGANVTLVSLSNVEEVPQPLRLYIPNAFTPNGDNLNDSFEVKGKFIQDYSLKIYNSMGQVVFASQDVTQSWDGTYRQKPLPPSVFVFEINLKAADGTTQTRKGTVTLIR